MIFLEVLICILIADLLSGFFHWLEDSYGQEDWLIIGDLVTIPNILHHHHPRHFVNASWWLRNRVLLFLGVKTLLISHLFHFFNWQILLVILVGTSANEIHRWAHQTPQENGRAIHFLQNFGVLQSPLHHAFHHQGQKNTHYCVITNWVNPIVDAMNLWLFLETLIAKLLGIYRRSDQYICQSEVQ
jgi:ubiquitin-conjugating enzyme E2 variant